MEIAASSCMNVRVVAGRSEEHTSELQSRRHLVCRLLLAKNHIISPVILDDLHVTVFPYTPSVAYGQSKTPEILMVSRPRFFNVGNKKTAKFSSHTRVFTL